MLFHPLPASCSITELGRGGNCRFDLPTLEFFTGMRCLVLYLVSPGSDVSSRTMLTSSVEKIRYVVGQVQPYIRKPLALMCETMSFWLCNIDFSIVCLIDRFGRRKPCQELTMFSYFYVDMFECTLTFTSNRILFNLSF